MVDHLRTVADDSSCSAHTVIIARVPNPKTKLNNTASKITATKQAAPPSWRLGVEATSKLGSECNY